MLRSRSSSAALARERPRLAPPLLVLALTLGMAATFVLVFPREDLVLRLASAPEGPLSAAYLRALLKTEPNNPRLRLLVAGNLLRAGRLDELRATLEPALASPDPTVQREALWLLWEASAQRAREPAPPALRRQRESALRALGLALARMERDPQRLARIAGSLFGLGEPQRAMEIFQALERQAPGTLLRHLEDAAALALAAGEHATAAEIHMAARRHAASREARRGYFLAALKDLESGNRLADALALAERELGDLADDRAVLLELVRLSRAAGRHDFAERYVRRLLRMSLLGQWQRLLAGFDHVLLKVAQDVVALPFDDPVYALAYTVFLENRKLEDAHRVAASAVRQAPDSLVWRRRLAQVSEWLQRPEEALEQWLFVARKSGEQEAWEAVRRLALGLLRDDALEAYLRHRLDSGSDATSALELAALQERQGRPEDARKTLARAWERKNDPRLATALAELSERLGALDEAILWWRRALGPRPDAERAVRLATVHVLLDEIEAARGVLDSVPDTRDAPPAFWRLKADLAERAGDREAALESLRHLASRPDATAGDLDTLEWLLAPDRPLEAAQVAAARWHRHRDVEAVIRAVSRYQDHARFDEAGTLLASLDAETRARLEHNARYCLLAARQAWQTRNRPEAQRLYALAEKAAPEDPDVLEAVLWFAIEQGEPATVHRLLARHGTRLRSKPEVLIAAHAALGDIPAAWLVAAPLLPRHRADPLWLMQAADLLEQLDRHDEAWQLRRHAVKQLPRGIAPEALTVARARLAASLAPGDAALSALRAALAEEKGEAAELLLAHWIRAGEYSLARAHAFGRLARNAARPRWAELAMALGEDDRVRLAELLAEPRGLPRRDAVEAASRLDRALAATLAFEGQERYREDDDLHAMLAPLLRAGGSHLGLGLEETRFEALTETHATSRVETALSPRLRLAVELGTVRRRVRDTAALGTAIGERGLTLRLDLGHDEGRWQLALGRREALAATTPLSLRWEVKRGHIGGYASAGRELPADESFPLRMAGTKDELALGISLAPLRPFVLAAEGAASRYRAQTGPSLGRGWRVEFHGLAALREEDPDLRLDLFASRHGFSPEPVGAEPSLLPLLPAGVTGFDTHFFLPQDFTLWGARLQSGTAYIETPGRAWRPFWALTLSEHNREGFGYDALVGAAGSLAGGDHGVAGLQWARAQGTSPGTTRRLFFHYRFDF